MLQATASIVASPSPDRLVAPEAACLHCFVDGISISRCGSRRHLEEFADRHVEQISFIRPPMLCAGDPSICGPSMHRYAAKAGGMMNRVCIALKRLSILGCSAISTVLAENTPPQSPQPRSRKRRSAACLVTHQKTDQLSTTLAGRREVVRPSMRQSLPGEKWRMSEG